VRRLPPASPLIAEVKLRTRDQDGLIQRQTRLVNQLTACLKAYYPVAGTLFGPLHQPTTLAFLHAFPTRQAAQAAAEEQITTVRQTAGHPHAARKAPVICPQLHQPQLLATPEVTRAKRRLLLVLVGQLAVLLPQIAAYAKEIGRLFLLHAASTVVASLPRARQRRAPRLLAAWGDDRGRSAAVASIQALAGTAPVPFTSGTCRVVHRRHAWSKPLRTALQQFAGQSTQQEPWAWAYDRGTRDEGKSHTMAVRALAHHGVRSIDALWRTHEAYDATIFLAAQQAHAPRAAEQRAVVERTPRCATPANRNVTRQESPCPSSVSIPILPPDHAPSAPARPRRVGTRCTRRGCPRVCPHQPAPSSAGQAGGGLGLAALSGPTGRRRQRAGGLSRHRLSVGG
jgi:hypothetical protein